MWLKEQGSSDSTVRHYGHAVERWIAELNAQNEEPSIAWIRSSATPNEKRLRGFACRKYALFHKDVMSEDIDLGVPSKLPPCNRPNPHPFEDGELEKVIQASKRIIKKPHTRVMIRVALKTYDALALRRSEIFGWEQVDFAKAEVTVLGKGGDTRTLPIPPKLLRILKWWKMKSPASPWTTSRGIVKPARLYKIFKQIAKGVGLPDIKLHWLRHNRLTRMAATTQGYDPVALAGFAGHRQYDSLRFYCRAQVSRMRELQRLSYQ